MISSVELEKKLSKIDKNLVKEEIFSWLIDGVENYIDNTQQSYSICFYSDKEKMEETAKLEELFLQVDTAEIEISGEDKQLEDAIKDNPAIEKSAEAQESIIEFMESIRTLMEEDEDSKKRLFDRISFYYSIAGFLRGTPIEKKIDGYIEITYLSFENFSVDVSVTPLSPISNDSGNITGYEKDESGKETHTMPESFAIDFSIGIWEKKNETSLF